MTSQDQADPARSGALAQQIVAMLTKEDPDTRRRAIQAALVLLGEASSISNANTRPPKQQQDNNVEPGALAEFFTHDAKLKPSDHAYLCAAYHFSLYGMTAFSLEELKDIAGEAGVVLPDRLDMTLTQAAKKGRKLFQPAGKGMFRPTASAGIVFKERWSVRPGKQAKTTTATEG